jgi:hypothetical protein
LLCTTVMCGFISEVPLQELSIQVLCAGQCILRE